MNPQLTKKIRPEKKICLTMVSFLISDSPIYTNLPQSSQSKNVWLYWFKKM